MDLDTSALEELMGDLKEDIIKMAISDVPETFTQEDTIQIDSNDDRLNYLFVKKDDVENKIFTPKEYISRDDIDYEVVVKKGKEETEDSLGTLDKTMPASFFQVKSVEEGTEYYLTKNPDLPEGVAEIMARYSFGDKQVKPEDIQKKSKKKKKKPDKLEVKHGKFIVDFS
tara:strand:- start:2279 stop:2788 length:510 start_codon:yes stop_codon:yes gene_type:complete